MPRFMRTILFLSTLSLLVVPTGNAQAQTEGEITGSVVAGSANSCAQHTETNAFNHKRCARGSFDGLTVELEATRDAEAPGTRTATCNGELAADQAIGFETRETLAEGRGFISPTTIRLPGFVVHDGSGPAGTECELRISGTFHRVGTDAFGGLSIDVHVDDTGAASRTFRHLYCATFEAVAVPVPGTTITAVDATVTGRRCTDNRYGKFGDVPGGAGRTSADDANEHGGDCVNNPPTVICD